MKSTIIDWSMISLKLRKHQSYRAMSEYTGISRPTLRRIARGEIDQPKFDGGLKLLDLAYDHLPGQDY